MGSAHARLPLEIALLFFLHLAADRLCCSYWSDPTLAKRPETAGVHVDLVPV